MWGTVYLISVYSVQCTVYSISVQTTNLSKPHVDVMYKKVDWMEASCNYLIMEASYNENS